MKKLFSAIVAAMLAVPSFAQYSSGGFELDKENLYYGFRIGLSMAGMAGDKLDYNDGARTLTYHTDLGMKAGLSLGGVIGLRLSHTTPVFLESGLYFTQTGGKKDDIKVTMNNLEIPLVVKYGLKASDEIALLPFFGIYFSHGISGKTKQKNWDGQSTEKVGSFAQKDAHTGGFKRNDMGLKLGCGAEYNKLYLEVGFKYGLVDVAKCGDDERLDLSAHNKVLFANFGVNF